MLVAGNIKLHKSVHAFSLPPIITCPNHELCYKTCYAVKIYNSRARVNAKKAWDRNYDITKNPATFWKNMSLELKRKAPKIVRIHVSGDFYSQSYVNVWATLANAFPEIQFYGFSKVFDIFDLSVLNDLKNVNIINSILPDGTVNYGSLGVSANKSWVFDVPVCQYSAGRPRIECGHTCKRCLTEKIMVFLQH